jgi:TorA maturation chaperone TorD
MIFEQFLETEILRRDAYQLLAACYALPDENLPKANVAMMAAAEKVHPGAGSDTGLAIYDTSIESLRIDYAKLFVGPFKLLAPPYGSVYLDGQRQVMGASTIEVQKRYQEAGLEMANNFREAPDHVAAELEFMYFLIFKEIEALESENLETTLDFLKLQSAFLQDHLGAWIAAFAFNVEENAETDFYKNLARVTKLFVQKDMAQLLSETIPTIEKSAA